MALDTLKVARRLRDAGFSEPQAEAVVASVQESSEGADFPTKGDLALLGTELRSEMREMEQRLIFRIESVKTELVGEFGSLKSELLSRMFTMIMSAVLINVVAVIGAMFAVAKLLGH